MKFLYLLLLTALSFTAQSQKITTSTIKWQGVQNFNVDIGDSLQELHTRNYAAVWNGQSRMAA